MEFMDSRKDVDVILESRCTYHLGLGCIIRKVLSDSCVMQLMRCKSMFRFSFKLRLCSRARRGTFKALGVFSTNGFFDDVFWLQMAQSARTAAARREISCRL